ncbi:MULTISPECIES: hypothetical protein [Bacillus]|jgi:regulatory protein YycI of two-component signal transduction system YycFG|uniref:DUF1433 domain-containing protein n=4 Tax=Bacillus TaxID=1386 RepID=A0A150B6A6_BACCE|nr:MULTISPECIES: hypothetical protein [Bacillus]ATI51532.1 DUF1433 domain-containing protein [Bacillus cereus]AUD24624.1 DUF1433 domain-containing protein [Bacillus sp. HBCD-sjtu]KAA2397648.1 DUF1433 domain-containing protein [Bacillus cereus]KLA15521.1 hypothetical protein B4087_1053 [Bacillus cereus]KMP73002.1 hypothetical protein TU57_03695 [Bacillus cereus]
MEIKRKKVLFSLILIILITIFGGCTMENKQEKQQEQQVIDKAKEETIKYFKETEGLDVTITKHKFGPKDFQTILISGYVTNDKSKKFTASVQYANDYHIGSISASNNFDFKH